MCISIINKTTRSSFVHFISIKYKFGLLGNSLMLRHKSSYGVQTISYINTEIKIKTRNTEKRERKKERLEKLMFKLLCFLYDSSIISGYKISEHVRRASCRGSLDTEIVFDPKHLSIQRSYHFLILKKKDFEF